MRAGLSVMELPSVSPNELNLSLSKTTVQCRSTFSSDSAKLVDSDSSQSRNRHRYRTQIFAVLIGISEFFAAKKYCGFSFGDEPTQFLSV
jgi:hypothetical protein